MALLRRGGNVNFTKTYLYFDTDEVTVETEYVLLDFGGTVSLIGGVVGMFLGWSILDVAGKIHLAIQKKR